MPRGRILAVDDQRYFRELIEGLLVEEGYEVQTCSSGEEALRVLDHSVFDVIITDLVMPVMTGVDLVQRVKERDPEQEIVVVTGVVDVKSAVDAMKIGATDYLLKPFDRATLVGALESILQRSNLRAERDRLLAENIEFLSERSLFERALGLFQATSVEALSEKVLDGLCRETGAQGGVLWWTDEQGGLGMRLAAAHGLVRLGEERERISEADLPDPIRVAGAQSALADWSGPEGLPRPALVVALRRGDALIGVIRLTDKLGGERFDDLDRTCVEKFMTFANVAFRNAERFRQLQRRSFQDAETGAYRIEYLQDVVRNEIERANRFGRSFGLLQVSLGPLGPLRQRLEELEFRAWHSSFVRHLGRLLRGTDVLAVDEDGEFCVLLAESNAIGAATFKQRTREALEQGEPLAAIQSDVRPELSLGTVTYPGDATQVESLFRVLEGRIVEDRRGRDRDRRLARLPLGAALDELAADAASESLESVGSLLRFAVSEIGRRPRERGVFFCRPGEALAEAFAEGLRLRRDSVSATDLVVFGGPEGIDAADERITWLPDDAIAGAPPFAVHFGDGPAYVMVAANDEKGSETPLFHSSERALAESLVFRLQRELRVPRFG